LTKTRRPVLLAADAGPDRDEDMHGTSDTRPRPCLLPQPGGMSRGFAGKRAVVTGAASGIGAAVVRLLCDEGAVVLAVDTNHDGLAALVAASGVGAFAHVADLARQDEVEAMIAAAVARFDGLDILVNNAGIGSLARAADLDPADWRRVMAVDLDAVFYAARVALPHLAASRGCIVNTASISGVGADYGFTAYNAAKAGVLGLTRVLAIDHARQGVRVNAVSPGFTATPMTALMPATVTDAFAAAVPMGRAGTPEEMADAIAFLASDRASYITGQNLIVDGGISAHTGQPDVVATAMAGRA
jgi:meso-butanediol dehydrogenase/(S,S)-butanediol dehydrogenase/diacetyl reductase